MLGLSPSDIYKKGILSKTFLYRMLKEKETMGEIVRVKNKVPTSLVRSLIESKGFKYPRINISFQIVKGGVGKTSMATNIAYRFAQYGAKVLFIDLDQQANATKCCGVDGREKHVFVNVFRGDVSIEKAITEVNENLHLLPSSLNNTVLESEMLTTVSLNLKTLIEEMLESVRNNYDIVIMDCPPAINRINAAATCYSDSVIIPINPDPYSIDGMYFTIDELRNIKKGWKLPKMDYRILWNKQDNREKLAPQYLKELMKDEQVYNALLPQIVRVDSIFKNSVQEGKFVSEYSGKSNAKEDIDEVARELLGINAWANSNNLVSE